MEKPGFFCAAPPRRGCLVLALWAALPFAAAALLCPWPAGRTGLAVLAAAAGLAARGWGRRFSVRAGPGTLRLRSGLLLRCRRRIPRRAVCGCTVAATPLLALAGCRLLVLYTAGQTHILPALARGDARTLAAWAVGGDGP